ncbi:MAG TPA: type II toxin-antitoxin system HicB family antitoxin [bacterium]|nr:type II toxin-antitoxin system HicB family antitoxin [bacterium]HPR89281.1 type II toxin-antitoxin system HicB family antitoxin [bacterium]
MITKKFIFYEEEGMFIGWLEEFPDYRTQGETLEELKANLLDMYGDLTGGYIPQVRQIGELVIA